MAQIKHALKNHDIENILMVSHQFKSSSALMGASRLAKQLKQIESLSRGGHWDEKLELLVSQAEAIYNETIQALENERN